MQKNCFKILMIVFAAACCSPSVYAQTERVNIGDTLAILNAISTTKGLLPPRMTLQQRNQVRLTPGLQVYCTDCTPAGPYSYNGTSWVRMFEIGSAITYAIGQDIQGGKIFWLDSTKQHGLIASVADQNGGIQWSNGSYTNTKAVRSGIYGGAFNTDHINEDQGNGAYASLVAAQYSGGGFGDWYLPSKEELNLMYQTKDVTGNLSGSYWSSTEVNVSADATSDFAWMQDFGNGSQSSSAKNTSFKVRAIRSF